MRFRYAGLAALCVAGVAVVSPESTAQGIDASVRSVGMARTLGVTGGDYLARPASLDTSTHESVVTLEHTGTTTASSICLGSVLSQVNGKNLGLQISSYATPNGIYNYELIPDTAGVIGLSLDPAGPFTPTLLVPIVVEDGYGFTRFYVEAHSSGSTGLHAPCEVDGQPYAGCMYWYDDATGDYTATDWILSTATVEDVFFTSDGASLSANPNAGGGWRVYPGRETPEAIERSNRVSVAASTSEPGLEVAFKVFDVDDPSSDSRPIDPKGSAGDDNFGCCAGVSPTFVEADGAGQATTELTVTMQPGDNFKVAASCDIRKLNELEAQGTDVVTADGQASEYVRVTDLLTVWRKLHIEVDSMGYLSGSQNVVIGNLASRTPNWNKDRSTLQLNGIAGLQKNQYQGGVMCMAQDKPLQLPAPQDCELLDNVDYFYPELTCYRVLSNGSGKGKNPVGDLVVIDSALPAIPNGSTVNYFMVDDDDADKNRCPDAIDLLEIEAPNLGYLTEGSDDVNTNALAPAYVSPVYDLGVVDAEQTPVILNIAEDSLVAVLDTYSFDYAAYEADPDFWTIYLHGGYQYTREEDSDPDTEAQTLGIATAQGASVFAEAIREAEVNDVATFAHAETSLHEVGHLVGGDHRDGLVMTASGLSPLDFFSDKTVNAIRHLLHPGAAIGDPIEKEVLQAGERVAATWATLEIETGDTEYTTGQSIDVSVRLRSQARHAQKTRSVDVRDGYLMMYVSHDGGPFRRYQGPRWGLRDQANGGQVELAPNGRLEAELSVLYNQVPATGELVSEYAEGVRHNHIPSEYAIESAGVYTLVAFLVDPTTESVITSNEVEIVVEEPRAIDLEVWSFLRANPEYGYFIQTGSPRWSSSDPRTIALVDDLSNLVGTYPDSKYSEDIRAALTKYSSYLAKK